MTKYTSATLVCCLLLAIGTTDGFAPNSRTVLQQQQSDRTSNPRRKRSPDSTMPSVPSSSTGLYLLQYSTGTIDESSSTTTVLSRSLSMSSSSSTASHVNETASRESLLLSQTQLLDPSPSSPPSLEKGSQPGWLEPVAWRAVIVVLCALWASNFAVAKLVMAEPGVDSSLYALSRFGVAAGSLAPFAIRAVAKGNVNDDGSSGAPIMDTETLKESIVCGAWVAFGYLGQTLGLMSTTASKSCVICSMHCVFVALVAEVWRVQKTASTAFDVKCLMPAIVAVVGVAIIELQGAGGAPSIGDALSFAQPIGFGMGYLILEKIMARKPEAALPVSAIKLTVVTVASLLLFEGSPLLNGGNVADLALKLPDFSPIVHSTTAMAGILYTGLVTTALALWVESKAFAKVPATDASLILTTEPLFAAACGAYALGETFGTSDYVGASLIVGACALSIFLDGPEAEPATSESNH